MKKQIFSFYFITLIFIFLLALLWEFILEPYLQPSFVDDFVLETPHDHWEYIKTILAFSSIALLVPTFIAVIIEKKRCEAIASLEMLQDRTAGLLEERTIELDSTRRQLIDPGTLPDQVLEKFKKTHVTLKTIINSLNDAILVIDLNYNVQMINKAAREAYLGNSDEAVPVHCHELSHKSAKPCSAPDHICPLDEVKKSRRPFTIIHKHIRKDGSVIPVEILASPILDKTGEVIGIIESARDISYRMADEEKRKENDQRFFVQQREHSIATLAGGIAHEFNNVLTSVMGNAELLNIRLEEKSPNRKQTDAIIKGSLQLADLTSQLLAYAKGGKYQSENISINKVIKDSLDLTHTGRFASIELQLNLTEDIWPVLGDPVQINQLVMNVLVNAFEALEISSGILEIYSSNITKHEKWLCSHKDLHPPGEYIQLVITNTGSQIPADDLARIFEPFFSTTYAGRGLGLSAAKGIVENHDGCINVESLQDSTSFQILLPKAVFDKEVMDTKGFAAIGIKGLKILVVDDEPQILSIIENLLTHHGCHVLTADKGSEALEIINRHIDDLDLVILDIQMPGMTGDEVYKKIKALNPAIRVLISSGYEEYTALRNVDLDASRDRFIKKPFSMVEILQKLKEILIQE